MRYCVRLPNSGPFASLDAIEKMAVAAEKLGYDAVSTHDHATWGWEDRYHNYAGSSEAVDSIGPPANFLDAMTTLSYLAGVTSRVQLIPDSICLSWRDVLLLARQAITLYQLSKGRFVLCVGAGNVKGDFHVTGTPFEDRLPISLEKLKVLRMVVDQDGPISFEGKYVHLKDAELYPKPKGMQIWCAGLGEVALKRTARYGEGWMPVATAEHIRAKLPELYQMAREQGRGNVKFEVASLFRTCVGTTDEAAWKMARRTVDDRANPVRGEWLFHYSDSVQQMARKSLVGSSDTVAEMLRDYDDAGTTIMHLGFVSHSVEELIEQLEIFKEEVMPSMHGKERKVSKEYIT